MDQKLLSQLNPAQRDAVLTDSGPLLVLAGAGTGKTRVVTYRIAHLMAHGTVGERILAVTFTNKAAAEMQTRVGQLLGKRVQSRPQISTFHSLCVKILRRHIQRLGYPSRFTIYTRGDQEGVARSVLREVHVPSSTMRAGDLLYQISSWKSHAVRPEQAASLAATDKEHLAAMAYRRYQLALRAAGAVDFDDLLLLTEDLFRAQPDVRAQESEQFDHLLIDEYQDTNASQYRIVAALAARHRNLCVVGDDDQSIYGWRGAEVKHILGFSKDWPDAKVVRLEENYRSTGEILQLANQLIVHNRLRHAKQLRAGRPGGERPRILQFKDEAAEAEGIVADIRRRLSQPGMDPRDFAILFRTNEQPRAFEAELRHARLPYILIGGMSFFDRKEVRDLLAYLRLLADPQDESSLLRIYNKPPRGIGEKSMICLTEAAVHQGVPVWRLLEQAEAVAGVTSAACAGLHRLAQTLERLRSRLAVHGMGQVTRELVEAVEYRREIEKTYKELAEQDTRWKTVEEFVNAVGQFEDGSAGGSLVELLDHLTLADRDFDSEKESQLRRNAIALLTLHSAKGLEYSQVYMVGMEENILPHHRSVGDEDEHDALDEERRLCYVGVTRAQDRLTLSFARSRRKWGKLRPTHPSRFLYEMTGQEAKPRSPAKADSRAMHTRQKSVRYR